MKPCRINKSLRYLSLLLSFIAATLCGCSALQRTQMPPRPENVPAGYELVGVPFYPQTAYQCGPSTLAMALTYRGLSVTPEELKSQVYTPSLKGSLQMDMVGATRRHGKIAYEITGPDAIFPEIAAGHPVIILLLMSVLNRPASAAMVGTEKLLISDRNRETRSYLQQMMFRKDIQEALIARGIDLQEAQIRIDSLTDSEIELIFNKITDFPAGGVDATFVLILVGVIVVMIIIVEYISAVPMFPWFHPGK
jgi:hypothetical protein